MDVPAIPANDSNPHSPTLRLWPPVLICLLVLCALIVPTVLAPGTIFQFFGMMLGPIVGAVLFALWWLFGTSTRSARLV